MAVGENHFGSGFLKAVFNRLDNFKYYDMNCIVLKILLLTNKLKKMRFIMAQFTNRITDIIKCQMISFFLKA